MLKAPFVLLVSGLLYYFSTGFHSVWWLMWFAPVPVLVYAYRARAFSTFVLSFLVGLVPGINEMIGYASTLLPFKILLFGTLQQAFVWSLVIFLSRFFTRRLGASLSVFAYPSILSVVDWLQSLGVHGTYASIAYTQLGFLPVMQIAALTGFFGITFVVSLFAAVLAYFVAFRNGRHNNLFAFVAVAIIVAVLVYGWLRGHEVSKDSAAQVKVGLVVVNPPFNSIYDARPASSILNVYAPLIAQSAQAGAQVVLLPEKTISVTRATRASVLKQASALAALNHVMLVMGVYEAMGQQNYNSAWVFDVSGHFVGEYDKEHLVPMAEAGVTPGTSLLTFPMGDILAGIAICRDLDFIDPAYQYGVEHVGILFVPAHDLSVDAQLHTEGAIMRGVENGYTVVRASKFGLLTVTSPTGKMLAQAPAVVPGAAVSLLVAAPVGTVMTFYDLYGDWFAWVLRAILVVLVFRCFFGRKDRRF